MRTGTILASAAILLSASCEYIPSDAVDPSFGVVAVTVEPKGVTLLVGDSAQLSATVLMSNNRPPRSVTWTSASPGVASVSRTGMALGLAAGSTFVFATSGSKRDSAAVTVVGPPPAPVASVTVTPTSATVAVGSVLQLAATPRDSAGNPLSGRTIAWSSSAPTVATVSGSGVVTGVVAGGATITATSEGKNGTSAITVVVPPPPPPPGPCTPSFGSFGVGAWPPSCYRPYDSTAWINRPLPTNPQLDPNSAAIVAALNSHGLPMDKGAGVVNDYDHPIYWSKASDLVYRLASCGYSGALTGSSFRALKGMLVGGGSDAHLVVMDQSTNTEWDFWQAVVDDNAQTISAHSCGKLPIAGDGRLINGTGSGDGGNAANTGLYTGQLREVEIEAGVMKHPIAITVTCTNGGWVYPASGSALQCGNSNEPADGQFFQLTYSDAEIDALPVPAWKKVVLHAMHQYGFYVDDTGAGSSSSPVSMQLHFESDKMFQAFGYEDPFVTYAKAHLGQDIYQSGGAYYYQLAPGVDWSRIQVVRPCVIQRTC